MSLKTSVLLVLLCCANLSLAQSTHSPITFTIKNAGLNVDGKFDSIRIEQQFDPNQLDSAFFRVEIQSTSINTGIKGRDRHLRKTKYFDVDNYPQITFISSRVTEKTTGFLLTGQLTIKKTTKTIEIPFSLEPTESGKYLKGYLEIDRRDFGVGKNHLIMGDVVKITIEVPYTPKG